MSPNDQSSLSRWPRRDDARDRRDGTPHHDPTSHGHAFRDGARRNDARSGPPGVGLPVRRDMRDVPGRSGKEQRPSRDDALMRADRHDSQWSSPANAEWRDEWARDWGDDWDVGVDDSDDVSAMDTTPDMRAQTPTPFAHDLWVSESKQRAGHRGIRQVMTKARRKRRFLATRRSRSIAIGMGVVILLATLGSGFVAYAQFQYTYQQAKSGLQHLKNAQADLALVPTHPFDTTNVARARGEFAAALQDFSKVNGTLKALPGGSSLAPVVGGKLGGAMRLVPIAIEAAQAGMLGCDIATVLMTKLQNPLSPSKNGLTSDDLNTITAKFEQLRALFNEVLAQVGALQPSDLTFDSRLGPALTAFKAKLPQIQQLINDMHAILPLAPQLFGTTRPASYLVEVLDSTELRPGGGFIGNYGLLTLTDGHMNGLHIQDVDLLDAPYKYGNLVIPLPDQYQWFAGTSPKWGFRDSNLEADFPTSAQMGESLYKQEGGSETLQGVIAITPWLIQDALRITGKIAVPEFNETVTADNMIPLIHKYQLSGLSGGPDDVADPNSGTSLRKRFTGYLFQHFMEVVKTQFSADPSKFSKLASEALHTKDIQVYFNAAPLEDVVRQFHADSTISAPATGDSLMAVDANIVASKINYYLRYTLTDQVTLDAQGLATHQTTLSYVWPADPASLIDSYPAGYPNLYIAYLRFYVPPGAQLVAQSGWQSIATPASAYGRAVWGGEVYVSYGSQTDITITWRDPKAAILQGNSWHYTMLLQRQAGVTMSLKYSLALPTCGTLIGAPPSGSTMPNPHTLVLNEPLNTDVPLAVNYSC